MLAAATIASGCIIPQEDHVLEELPRRKNRPPRIIPERISPPEVRVPLKNGPECQVEFTVAVEDPDIDNIIRVAYFVDFDPTIEQNPTFGSPRELAPSSSTVRPETVRASFKGSSLNTTLFSVGRHFVDVIVSDTGLDDERLPGPATVFADGGFDPGYSDRFTWVVETEAGNCP